MSFAYKGYPTELCFTKYMSFTMTSSTRNEHKKGKIVHVAIVRWAGILISFQLHNHSAVGSNSGEWRGVDVTRIQSD